MRTFKCLLAVLLTAAVTVQAICPPVTSPASENDPSPDSCIGVCRISLLQEAVLIPAVLSARMCTTCPDDAIGFCISEQEMDEVRVKDMHVVLLARRQNGAMRTRAPREFAGFAGAAELFAVRRKAQSLCRLAVIPEYTYAAHRLMRNLTQLKWQRAADFLGVNRRSEVFGV